MASTRHHVPSPADGRGGSRTHGGRRGEAAPGDVQSVRRLRLEKGRQSGICTSPGRGEGWVASCRGPAWAVVGRGQRWCFCCKGGSGETEQKMGWKCCQQSRDRTWPPGTGSSQPTQRRGFSIIPQPQIPRTQQRPSAAEHPWHQGTRAEARAPPGSAHRGGGTQIQAPPGGGTQPWALSAHGPRGEQPLQRDGYTKVPRWHLSPVGTSMPRGNKPKAHGGKRGEKGQEKINKQPLCFAQFPGTSEAGLGAFSPSLRTGAAPIPVGRGLWSRPAPPQRGEGEAEEEAANPGAPQRCISWRAPAQRHA